jgi:hypothetical protein
VGDFLRVVRFSISHSGSDNGSVTPNKAVFGFCVALLVVFGTCVLATYYVTVSLGTLLALTPNSPKSKSEADRTVIMGDLREGSGIPPKASESNPALEAALDRLLQGIRLSRGG